MRTALWINFFIIIFVVLAPMTPAVPDTWVEVASESKTIQMGSPQSVLPQPFESPMFSDGPKDLVAAKILRIIPISNNNPLDPEEPLSDPGSETAFPDPYCSPCQANYDSNYIATMKLNTDTGLCQAQSGYVAYSMLQISAETVIIGSNPPQLTGNYYIMAHGYWKSATGITFPYVVLAGSVDLTLVNTQNGYRVRVQFNVSSTGISITAINKA